MPEVFRTGRNGCAAPERKKDVYKRQGHGQPPSSGSLEDEERELELLLEEELELEELDALDEDQDELPDEEELELLKEHADEELELLEDDELEEELLELLEEELEDGALLEESGSWGTKELTVSNAV